MDQIVSMVIADGVWAALFCCLLVYVLRDSRKRETRYTQTRRALSERLGVVNAVKSDTEEIKSDVGEIKDDTAVIRAVVGEKHESGVVGGGVSAPCPVV